MTGGTNKELDLQNPDNLGQQPTDNGVVPNLKWSFSDSKTRLLKGGWVREQVIQDLPQRGELNDSLLAKRFLWVEGATNTRRRH